MSLRPTRFRRFLLLLLAAQAAACDSAFPVGKIERVDFATLQRKNTPNQYIVCPPGLCARAEPDAVSPAFPITASALRDAFEEVALAAPRTNRVAEFDNGAQVVYVQRTAIFRFPDIISVAFIEQPDAATLAIYSRSVYGRSDLGVNRRRIEGWLRQLPNAVAGRVPR